MKDNSVKLRLSSPVNRIHAEYVAIAKKHPGAKDGIKRVEAFLDRTNECNVAFLGSNAEATQRVARALLSCEPPPCKPPLSLAKKALRYVASAELSKPISREHHANLKANYGAADGDIRVWRDDRQFAIVRF